MLGLFLVNDLQTPTLKKLNKEINFYFVLKLSATYDRKILSSAVFEGGCLQIVN